MQLGHIELSLQPYKHELSRVMREPTFCIYENKKADQLHSKCAADQQLCFRYIDSMIPLLYKSVLSSLSPSYVVVQPGLYQTWSESGLVFSRRFSINSMHIQRYIQCSV